MYPDNREPNLIDVIKQTKSLVSNKVSKDSLFNDTLKSILIQLNKYLEEDHNFISYYWKDSSGFITIPSTVVITEHTNKKKNISIAFNPNYNDYEVIKALFGNLTSYLVRLDDSTDNDIILNSSSKSELIFLSIMF